jgi:hypothetical protein
MFIQAMDDLLVGTRSSVNRTKVPGEGKIDRIRLASILHAICVIDGECVIWASGWLVCFRGQCNKPAVWL